MSVFCISVRSCRQPGCEMGSVSTTELQGVPAKPSSRTQTCKRLTCLKLNCFQEQEEIALDTVLPFWAFIPTTRMQDRRTEYSKWPSTIVFREGGGSHWMLGWAHAYGSWLSEHWTWLKTSIVLMLQKFVEKIPKNSGMREIPSCSAGEMMFVQDSSSLCLENFKVKWQSTSRVRWQVRRAVLDHHFLTYVVF